MKWELDLWYELWDRAGSQGLDTWHELPYKRRTEDRQRAVPATDVDSFDVMSSLPEGGPK